MSTLTDNQNLLFKRHKEELMRVIHDLVEKLKHEGLLPELSKEDEVKLINTVADKILGLNPKIMDTMRDKVDILLDAKRSNEDKKAAETHLLTFFNSLQLCLMAEDLKKKDKTFELNYAKLFLPKHMTPDAKKELKHTLKLVFTMMNNKMPENEKLKEAELEALTTKVADLLMKNYMNDKNQICMAQNKGIINTLLECVAQASSLRSLFGVAKPGEIPRPVPAVMGNLFGFSLFVGPSGSSRTFRDGLDRFDNEAADPNGIEHNVLANDVSAGCVNAIKATASHAATESMHKSPTPFNTGTPTLKPPGNVES